MGKLIDRLLRRKKLTVKEELDKIVKRLDDADAKYKKNPTWQNAHYFNELLDITEELVNNLEKIQRESQA